MITIDIVPIESFFLMEGKAIRNELAKVNLELIVA